MVKKFIIEPHMRLQEWVAVEKGYFDDEIKKFIHNCFRLTRPFGEK